MSFRLLPFIVLLLLFSSQPVTLSYQRERPPTKGYISGRVLTAQSKPVSEILVVLEAAEDSTRHYETRTSAAGYYTFPDIPVGRYVLSIYTKEDRKTVRTISHRPVWTRVIGNTGRGRAYEWPSSTVNVTVSAEATPTPTPTTKPSPKVTPTPIVTPTPVPTATTTPAATPNPSGTTRPPPSPELIPNASPTTTPSPGSQQTPTPGSTPIAKIDQILASMEFGNISFNVPPSMTLQKAEEVRLLLSLKQTSEQLAQQLKTEGAAGDVKEARIKVHDKMQAVISGDGFLITPSTPDTLPVSKEQTTEWKWDVRAQRPGTLRLHVILNAIVDLDDGSGAHPYPIKTFDQTYVVAVPWSDGAVATFIKNNWQWLWATIVLPVGGWLWHRNRKKDRGPAGFTGPKAK